MSSLTKNDIPFLSESAADLEVERAWNKLNDLQRRLREKRAALRKSLPSHYEKSRRAKKERLPAGAEIEDLGEEAAEEKSRAARQCLICEGNGLAGNRVPLPEGDTWPSK